MLNILGIYPAGLSGDTANALSGFIRSILMKSSFNINIKRTLGIAGFYSNYCQPECWTVKCLRREGVYGLYIKDTDGANGVVSCTLGLKYFPDPDEKILDYCSIAEIFVAEEGTYTEMIRNFISVPALENMFDIADIHLTISGSRELALTLKTETYTKTVIEKGLYVKSAEGLTEIVPPMGADKNFPSLKVALSFFKTFAGSVTYCLQKPASSFTKSHAHAGATLIRSRSESSVTASSDIKKAEYTFRYGGDSIIETTAFKTVTADNWWSEKSLNNDNTILDNRPKLLIITGFLGSGKTTFIKKLLEHETEKNRFAGVIQNEAGDTGLDGYLLDYDCSLVQIDDGCVCCSLSGQLKAAVKELSKERVPDTIILETSGVANPMNLLDELKDLKELVRFDSVTTIVDSANALNTLEESELMKEQIKAADIIVFNKADLNDNERLYKVVELLNPDAFYTKAAAGEVNFALLYGSEREDFSQAGDVSSSGVNHSHEHIITRKIELSKPLSVKELTAYINDTAPNAFRVKGVVDVTDRSHPVIIQGVQGKLEFSRPERETEGERFLVIIEKDAAHSHIH